MKNINYYIYTLLLLFIVFISCEEDNVIPTNALPVAEFSMNPEAPVKGEPVVFTDASTDSDGTITSWLWNFGDGTVSQEKNPKYTFNFATGYEVRLTVKDDKNGEDTIIQEFIVSDPLVPNVPPTASFSISGGLFQKGAEVGFTDSSTDSDGVIVSWAWDFGDGNTATTKNPIHFYGDVGLFTITLTVTDNSGDASTVFAKDVNVWGTKWSYATTNAIKPSTPAIADDGTIYVGSDDDSFYAINNDGTLKWSFATGGNIRNSPSIAMDGTIYIGSDDDNLYALNPDGTQKWAFDTGGNVNVTSSAIGADGTIYTGGSADTLFALNPDGTEKWNYPADGDILSIALTGNILYFTHNGGRNIVSVNATNGALNWSLPHGAFTGGSMAIDADNTVYFQGDLGGGAGKIWAIKSDGTEKWSFPLTGSASRGGVVLSSDGTLYASTKETSDHFRAINSADGTEKWSYTTQGKLSAAAAVDSDGNVYIGGEDDSLYVLDSSGNLKFEFATGGNIWGSATIGTDGTVYFGSYDGNLYAMEFFASGLDIGVWPKLGANLKNTTAK
jgi:outer membrane protein assembly factor BamB